MENENTQGLKIEELLANLLELLDEDMGMKVKNSTLVCLDLLLTTGYADLLKYRAQVVSKVKKHLDDRKRSTRRLAVKCINDWSIA